MKVHRGDKYNLISLDKASFQSFIEKSTDFKAHHLLVEVSENLNIDEAKISLLLGVADDFKKSGMSFVVIKSGLNVDNFPEILNIVPTLQEAEDILEMEAIERDLGF